MQKEDPPPPNSHTCKFRISVRMLARSQGGFGGFD